MEGRGLMGVGGVDGVGGGVCDGGEGVMEWSRRGVMGVGEGVVGGSG